VKRPRVLYVGRTTLDVLYRVNRFPEEDTKMFADATAMVPGGPATNAAITHALLMGEAGLLTALGRTPRAAFVRAELQRHRITVIDLAASTAYETPLSTVLVNTENGTRTVVNPPPSPVALPQVTEWDNDWGALPSMILCDGFRVKETLPLLQRCHAAGVPICLDGGSWKPGTEDLIPLLTVAICSERFTVPGLHPQSDLGAEPEQETDAALEAGSYPEVGSYLEAGSYLNPGSYPDPGPRPKTEEQPGPQPDATLRWLQEHGVACAAVTRGARPIVGLERGRRFEIEVPAVHAVDTLGAGDVLHGAFCLRYAATGDFEGSLRFASVIATQSCRGFGIGAWRMIG
jgi:sugar/nucleoside kinase (ribokinase family)